uniref:Fork-head domain-containing protein n=1 Tax=Esox lucius TaxID=8010 RepID=A0AAY5KL36_ESOLU
MTEKISLQAPSNGVPQRKHRRYGKNKSITYLGLVANVIQDSPEKMLTFTQLMDRLEAFISGDRKGIENNIRVCLSSNDCFVKVPADPYVTYSKKNLWKFDESRITAKMARRNFKGILDHFPDLSTKVRKESRERKFEATDRTASLHSPTQELDCAPIQRKTEGKFTSSFSIDSILNTGSSRLCPQARQLSVVSRVPTDQVLLCAESGMGTKRGMSSCSFLRSNPFEF